MKIKKKIRIKIQSVLGAKGSFWESSLEQPVPYRERNRGPQSPGGDINNCLRMRYRHPLLPVCLMVTQLHLLRCGQLQSGPRPELCVPRTPNTAWHIPSRCSRNVFCMNEWMLFPHTPLWVHYLYHSFFQCLFTMCLCRKQDRHDSSPDGVCSLLEKVGIEHKMPGALSVRKETCTVNWEPTWGPGKAERPEHCMGFSQAKGREVVEKVPGNGRVYEEVPDGKMWPWRQLWEETRFSKPESQHSVVQRFSHFPSRGALSSSKILCGSH